MQRVEVDGHPAYVLTELIGPVELGDRVVVNTTAVDLGLGSGGFHIVHWNLARDQWEHPGAGPIMKLRYTSLQCDTGAAEEAEAFKPAPDLGGLPVVACDLHSHVAWVAMAFHQRAPHRRLVYVMTDQAALPLALSDRVAELRERGVLAASVSMGHAFGGDYEAVNLYSALQVAHAMAGADAVVVGPGPGVVGTRTRLGFGGLEVLGVTDAAARLGGRPIVAVRSSDADGRAEHRSISHHSATCLGMISVPTLVAVPNGETLPVDLLASIRAVSVDLAQLDLEPFASVTSMGRRGSDDPASWRWPAAAGLLAADIRADRAALS